MYKSHPNATFMTVDIVTDLAATSLILGIILSLIVLPLTTKDVNNGKIARQEGSNKVSAFLPNNKYLSILVVGIITMVIITVLTWFVVMIFNLSPLTVKTMCTLHL